MTSQAPNLLLPLLGGSLDPASAQEKPVESRFGWATITSTAPLRIRKDGEASELPMTPEVIGGLSGGIGTRVWCQYFGLRVLVLGSGTAPSTLLIRAQGLLKGGGQLNVTSTTLGWTGRFMLMGGGRNATVPDGYFEITMPPNGTVIPRIGANSGASSVTVSGSTIAMSNWDTLYYELPLRGSRSTENGNFHLVNYSALYDVPSSWVMVCHRNGDSDSTPYWWGNGREQDYWRNVTLTNGWVNYGGTWPLAQYKRERGWVEWQGFVKNGAGGAIGSVPSGYWPDTIRENGMTCNGPATGIVRVSQTGVLSLYSYGGGSNGWVSLNQIRYEASA